MNTKGALQSKAVWGAILTLIGAFGLLPLGIQYDADAGNLIINVQDIATQVGLAATGVGGVLALVGRLVARTPISGLWQRG